MVRKVGVKLIKKLIAVLLTIAFVMSTAATAFAYYPEIEHDPPQWNEADEQWDDADDNIAVLLVIWGELRFQDKTNFEFFVRGIEIFPIHTDWIQKLPCCTDMGYYSPRLGRFTSEDPIRVASGSLNFYTYCENSPIDWHDPFGLAGKPIKEFITSNGGSVVWDSKTQIATFTIGNVTLTSSGTGVNNKELDIYVEDGKLMAEDNDLYCIFGAAINEKNRNSNAGDIFSGGLVIAGVTSQLDTPMIGPADAAGAVIAFGTVVVAGSVKIYDTLTAPPLVMESKTKVPSGLKDKNTGKVKTPDTHSGEFNKTKEGTYTHNKTGWIFNKDKSGHRGDHWDAKPKNGKTGDYQNVSPNGNIL